jgi:hypothetical protein
MRSTSATSMSLSAAPGPAHRQSPARAATPGALAAAEADLAERVPGAAVAALPLPLGVVRAAVAAHEGGFCPGHGTGPAKARDATTNAPSWVCCAAAPIRQNSCMPGSPPHPRYPARVLRRTRHGDRARGGGTAAADPEPLPAPAGHPRGELAWLHVSEAYLLQLMPFWDARVAAAHLRRPWKPWAWCASTARTPRRDGLLIAINDAPSCPAGSAAGPAAATRRTAAPPAAAGHAIAPSGARAAAQTARGPPGPRRGTAPAAGFSAQRGHARAAGAVSRRAANFALQQRRTSRCTGANAAAPDTPGKTASNSMYNSTGPVTSRNNRG